MFTSFKDYIINESDSRIYNEKFTKKPDLFKAIKDLPDTIQSIKIPSRLGTVSDEPIYFHPPIDKDWKEKVINSLKDTMNKYSRYTIDYFVLYGSPGIGKIDGKKTISTDIGDFIVSIHSRENRKYKELEKSMDSGKMGSLD